MTMVDARLAAPDGSACPPQPRRVRGSYSARLAAAPCAPPKPLGSDRPQCRGPGSRSRHPRSSLEDRSALRLHHVSPIRSSIVRRRDGATGAYTGSARQRSPSFPAADSGIRTDAPFSTTVSGKSANTASLCVRRCQLMYWSMSQKKAALKRPSPRVRLELRNSPVHGECGCSSQSEHHGRPSNTRLKGVSVARRNEVKPADLATSVSLASPAWAPSPAPTSCDSDAGVQMRVDAA